MSRLYGKCHRALQDRHANRKLADLTEQAVLHDVFTSEERDWIERADLFFLSTVGPDGQPTVSYKGGRPGFVRVQENVLHFPVYDGNGMFLSAGNVAATTRVGLLFVDFERPRRLRVHGQAMLDESEAGRLRTGALFTVCVVPTQIFVNCPRYIHRYRKIEDSKYCPSDEVEVPLPQWKRLDFVQDGLRPAEREVVARLGTIDQRQYDEMVLRGEG